MGRPFNDITGKVYGTLKVLRKTEKRAPKGEILWECECLICGDLAYATSSDLNRGRRGYCKTCRNKIATMSPIKALYGEYKRGAKLRNYCFELSIDDFMKIIKQKCHYCGSEPFQVKKKEGSRCSTIYNGIDRKDNSKGYTLENAVPCCKFCNLAKSTYPAEELIAWINRIRNNQKCRVFRTAFFCTKKSPRIITEIFVFRKSVDFNGNLLVYANGTRTHYSTDRLGNSALLADYSAHVVGSNVEMIYHSALCVRLVNRYLHRALVLD